MVQRLYIAYGNSAAAIHRSFQRDGESLVRSELNFWQNSAAREPSWSDDAVQLTFCNRPILVIYGHARDGLGSRILASLKLQFSQRSPEEQVRLDRIEMSDGTVGWEVIRISDGTILGDIIRIQRVSLGKQPRLSYYGRKDPLYFGREFATKGETINYITNRSSPQRRYKRER